MQGRRRPVLIGLMALALSAGTAVAAPEAGAARPVSPAMAQDDSREEKDGDPCEDDDDFCEEDDDSEGLERYDTLPPDTTWPVSVGLPGVPDDITGRGVTVAVLDTGITRTADFGDRVVARVDLTPECSGFDSYGHGTHMAGIVAGDGTRSGGKHRGVATEAGLIPIRLSEWNGATDVSQVLAGLEWVAVNQQRYGIRVVNLSYGTDATQKHDIDPLNHAVQRLWRQGVLVVVSAGNRGGGGQKIDKPGDDPYVVTVGAADTRRTASTADDQVADFSSRGPTGENVAKPDLVAPGISIVSQRAAGSTIDAMRPAAREGEHYFRGTGSSQAAAVVSGTAALMFQAAPSLTPDEAKAALVGTASLDLAGASGAGAGLVHAGRAVQAASTRAFVDEPANANLTTTSGLGSIDSSRGGDKPFTDANGDGTPEQISGEVDALGHRWEAATWASRRWDDATWASSPWAPLTRVSPGWAPADRPDGRSWAGLGWDEDSWTNRSWREAGLTPGNWTNRSWRSNAWN